MRHRRHFDTNEFAGRNAVQVRKTVSKMISDLDQIVQLLDCDITTEEQRAGCDRLPASAYPMLARLLGTRRDNLMDTIAALEQRLAALDGELMAALA